MRRSTTRPDPTADLRRSRLHPARSAGRQPDVHARLRRYERASLILTSNRPFSAWAEIFGDEVTSTAMIDRLVHHEAMRALKRHISRELFKRLAEVPLTSQEHP
jgi:hypothetical protein